MIAPEGYGSTDTGAARVLLLPGWQNSGPGHWQTHWEARFGDERVVQDDWLWPRRGDWLARLDEVLLARGAAPSVLLAAHSLGCHLVAAWAAHSRLAARVCGALLVAPPDTERDDMPPQIFNWRPMVRRRLPFPSRLVFSRDDPYCSVGRALSLARDWGSETVDAGDRGHLNGESKLGDWPRGRAHLDALRGNRR